jgi:enoyl-CoA hydratase/carnithine racemase
MPEEIIVEDKGFVRTIKMNRPDRLNAITSKMLQEMNTALKQADNDINVRVIILTGAGKGFCSGLDLKEAAAGRGIGGEGALSKGGGAVHFNTRDIVTITLHEMDTPVICAINGAAAGYGLDLALGADIRVMSDTAKLAPGFAKRGIVPESGGTWYLPRLIGWAKACEISFLAQNMTPDEAKEMGLVNKIFAAEEFQAKTMEMAETIASNAPLAIAAMKRLFRHGLSEDFPSHTHHVLLQLAMLMKSNDFQEGIASFMERRDPDFTGS